MEYELMYGPEELLIYIFFKWLYFKLIVPLISNHTFNKAKLIKDVNICSYSNASKTQAKQYA